MAHSLRFPCVTSIPRAAEPQEHGAKGPDVTSPLSRERRFTSKSSGSAACTAYRAVTTTAFSSLSRSFCGVHRHAWHTLVHITPSISDPILPKRVCLAHIRIGDMFCLRLGAYARSVILLRIADGQSSLDRHNSRRMARRPAATDTLDLYVGAMGSFTRHGGRYERGLPRLLMTGLRDHRRFNLTGRIT
jgi:hypothetical protein